MRRPFCNIAAIRPSELSSGKKRAAKRQTHITLSSRPQRSGAPGPRTSKDGTAPCRPPTCEAPDQVRGDRMSWSSRPWWRNLIPPSSRPQRSGAPGPRTSKDGTASAEPLRARPRVKSGATVDGTLSSRPQRSGAPGPRTPAVGTDQYGLSICEAPDQARDPCLEPFSSRARFRTALLETVADCREFPEQVRDLRLNPFSNRAMIRTLEKQKQEAMNKVLIPFQTGQ